MENKDLIIYKAENTITGQVYIGSTTKSIDERKADHFQKALSKSGFKFQEAISTYGFESFKWEQIDTAKSINELATKEVQYIQDYDAISNGYNSDRGGGIKKRVFQFDVLSGKLLSEFESLTQAAESVNAIKQNISDVCLGHYNTCKGFAWSYEENYTVKTDKRKKNVIQSDIQGNYINKYSSIAEASRLTGISKTCIARCCRGDRQNTHGFVFEYY